MKAVMLILAALAIATPSQGALKGEKVEYHQGNQVFEGYLVYDDVIAGKRPGVIVIPEWWGLNDFARKKADDLARLGYAAFAVDMYGGGMTTSDVKKATELATPLKKDRALMRERAKAGLEILRKHKTVNPKKIVAIGFCFGGTTALELARSGADLNGVVSFHGNLDTPLKNDVQGIKAKVLVLHGSDDPFVMKDEVLAFVEEMRLAKVDWQMNVYGGAVHSFTNPDADKYGLKGAGYNEKAAQRAWEAMKLFFAEIFR